MKIFTKFFGILLICIFIMASSPVIAQSPTADTTKSTTAAGAPASNDPSVTPTADAQKNKQTDATALSSDKGMWGLLGFLGLLGLLGLRRNRPNR